MALIPIKSPIVATVVFKKLPKGTIKPTGVLFVKNSKPFAHVLADTKLSFPGKLDQFTDAMTLLYQEHVALPSEWLRKRRHRATQKYKQNILLVFKFSH